MGAPPQIVVVCEIREDFEVAPRGAALLPNPRRRTMDAADADAAPHTHDPLARAAGRAAAAGEPLARVRLLDALVRPRKSGVQNRAVDQRRQQRDAPPEIRAILQRDARRDGRHPAGRFCRVAVQRRTTADLDFDFRCAVVRRAALADLIEAPTSRSSQSGSMRASSTLPPEEQPAAGIAKCALLSPPPLVRRVGFNVRPRWARRRNAFTDRAKWATWSARRTQGAVRRAATPSPARRKEDRGARGAARGRRERRARRELSQPVEKSNGAGNSARPLDTSSAPTRTRARWSQPESACGRLEAEVALQLRRGARAFNCTEARAHGARPSQKLRRGQTAQGRASFAERPCTRNAANSPLGAATAMCVPI